jgi:glycoprotein endo-alpha-1,2-mannosidase
LAVISWFASLFCAIALTAGLSDPAQARLNDISRQVLAFYYGWYGNPTISGRWIHWKNSGPSGKQIANSTDVPALGAYDSHDPEIVDGQAREARAAGITGFIASWWGQGSFEDHGMPLLLSAAAKHGLVVSAYYESVEGDDPRSRKAAAVADLDYLMAHYATDKAWLRAGGKPVVFVYARALHALEPAGWQQVIQQVRRDNPGGIALIADALDPTSTSIFDGASTYNITGQIQDKTPAEVRAWARVAYPRMVASAGAGKISTVTVIPGYDDRELPRPPPRPVTARWDGEVYQALWEEAIAAAPNYVLITSWNEWHEGSELEPSFEYGSHILKATTSLSRAFLSAAR